MKSVMICVPSKNRVESFKKKTLKILNECGIPWKVFVEPQDYEHYLSVVTKDRLVQLKKNDQGLGYALSNICSYALDHRIGFVWKMDDDISHLYNSSKVLTKLQQAQMVEKFAIDTLQEMTRIPRFSGVSFPNKFFHSDFRPVTHINKPFETTYIVDPRFWFVPEEMKGHNEEPVASAAMMYFERIVLRTGMIAWDADLSKLDGGFQTFSPGDQRPKQQALAFDWLKEHYPGIYDKLKVVPYTQKDGRIFSVVDKKSFNREHSIKLPLTKHKEHPRYVQDALNKLKDLGYY